MRQLNRSGRPGGRRRRTAVVATAVALAAGALLAPVPAEARRADDPTATTGPAPEAATTDPTDPAGATEASTSGAGSEGTAFAPDTQLAAWQLYQDLYRDPDGQAVATSPNPQGCQSAGTTPEHRRAVLDRVNYFRAMAGVPAGITLNADYNALAQRVALMMAANRSISHAPPSSWACWTQTGAAAANRSNLWLSRYGADAVTGWIEDPGSGNTAAGHRRWVLHPPTRQMGTGSVRGPSSDVFRTASALYVMDSHIFDPVPTPRDGFVAWPPPGFVPDDLVFDRFSFGIDGANFANADVVVRRGANIVADTEHPQANGYGINTLVWEVPAADHQPADYHVTIRGVTGAPRSVYEYDIHAFDVTVPPEPVTLTTPADQAEYARGRTVLADYSCQMPNQASCVGTVPDGSPIDTSTLGPHRFTVTATDSAGAQEVVTHTYDVVDRTKPSITITSPAPGASFVQGRPATADFSCADDVGGSGLASCVGTVADGAPLNTNTLGASRPFSVTATDGAGNQRTVDQPYAVTQRPDALIAASGGPAPVGDGVYSPTASPAQAVSTNVTRGSLGTYAVTIQNDGGVAATFLLKSTVTDGAGFRVTYRNAAGTDITSAVNAGTYSTGNLPVGQSVTITMRVKAKSTATLGATVKVDLAARNGAGPFVRDVVRAKVTAAAPAS